MSLLNGKKIEGYTNITTEKYNFSRALAEPLFIKAETEEDQARVRSAASYYSRRNGIMLHCSKVSRDSDGVIGMLVTCN